MAEYIVYSSETVTYRTLVEAVDEEAARELVLDGDVAVGEVENSTGFQVDAVEAVDSSETT